MLAVSLKQVQTLITQYQPLSDRKKSTIIFLTEIRLLKVWFLIINLIATTWLSDREWNFSRIVWRLICLSAMFIRNLKTDRDQVFTVTHCTTYTYCLVMPISLILKIILKYMDNCTIYKVFMTKITKSYILKRVPAALFNSGHGSTKKIVTHLIGTWTDCKRTQYANVFMVLWD